ncbi:MAG: hypothetical protein JWN03_5741 [Nocardia sp.]|nr:hypothetical protein [Nocardia sp.]MCU1645466.1 hypothetical protein [Nocardia sp.]
MPHLVHVLPAFTLACLILAALPGPERALAAVLGLGLADEAR